MDLHGMVSAAERRIRPIVRETPLEYAPALSEQCGAQVYLKLESLQHTRSFKLRGAANKLLSIGAGELARGVVTASSGNHGAAVAYACRRLGARGLVFVPAHAAPTKVAAIRRLGAEVRTYGDDSVETEAHARAYAEQHGQTYVPPYNDWAVVAGQGTVGAELARQLERIDAVFVAVGGGGLIGGIAGYLRVQLPQARIIGCLPANSPVMAASVQAGRLLDMPALPTLSDGTAGGVEPGSITFELCRTLVDEYLLVSEQQIAAAMRACIAAEQQLIEGAAGVALAAFLAEQQRFRGQNVAVVICGGNVGLETLRQVIEEDK